MRNLSAVVFLAFAVPVGGQVVTSEVPALPRSTAAEAGPSVALPSAMAKLVRLQTLLAREGFSPGLIDGKPGRKTKVAVAAFQAARGLTASGTADEATMALLAGDDKASFLNYQISGADEKLITGVIPEDWNERAKLTVSGYATMQEMLAERGWCSEGLVAALNPGVNLESLRAGDVVVLPAVNPKAVAKVAHVEVDLSEKLVKGFDAGGTQVLLMHCSIARLAEKRPVGELKVQVVAMDPSYTFDPKDWPEVSNVTRKLVIAPGPRCPVGAAWVGLDKPGYGMHGTIRPMDIGKTGSHGCFRLANWDAVRLAKAVRLGTTVNVAE